MGGRGCCKGFGSVQFRRDEQDQRSKKVGRKPWAQRDSSADTGMWQLSYRAGAGIRGVRTRRRLYHLLRVERESLIGVGARLVGELTWHSRTQAIPSPHITFDPHIISTIYTAVHPGARFLALAACTLHCLNKGNQSIPLNAANGRAGIATLGLTFDASPTREPVPKQTSQ